MMMMHTGFSQDWVWLMWSHVCCLAISVGHMSVWRGTGIQVSACNIYHWKHTKIVKIISLQGLLINQEVSQFLILFLPSSTHWPCGQADVVTENVKNKYCNTKIKFEIVPPISLPPSSSFPPHSSSSSTRSCKKYVFHSQKLEISMSSHQRLHPHLPPKLTIH